MSLKQDLETWVQALAHYDNNEFEESLKIFEKIADTSKIHFNSGVIYATLGEHEKAIEFYQKAIGLDKFLAVAYFQQGVSNFLVGAFEAAAANFDDTLHYLRGNRFIDYDQIGLKFKLYSCEALFNRGLCYIYLQQAEAGMKDIEYAAQEKVTPDHEVIDEAIREQAEGYTVFSIPVGTVYRPNEAKVRNLATKDYLGTARLVAASDKFNTFTGFAGSQRKPTITIEPQAKDDRPPQNISYAASNLVQRGGRDQSAPPAMDRNLLPPTPPPENDKPLGTPNSASSMTGRAASVRSPAHRPGTLKRSVTTATSQGDSGHHMSADEPSLGKMVSPRARPTGRRAASETRGSESRRSRQHRLYGEVPEEALTEDLYDMYQAPALPRSRSRRGPPAEPARSRKQPAYIHEEEEYDSEEYEDDDCDFEMLGGAGSRSSGIRASRPSFNRRPSSRQVDEVKQIRVKIHFNDEIRYMMVGLAVELADFEGRVREKFGLRKRPKVLIEDDGDMITMRDQDDLDVLVASSRSAAKRENQDMAKMEIWVQ